ncbi:DUF3311 domain-containing protein [Mycolicibacterium wolinskyi]|uniref:DUF3311 domain-containing protein n=1 Tax=Mycolicibacterium wolinskyi TaxID=59750 RepID=A0A1X2FB57_9MYCO|nr:MULTISPECIES: DUF3311 domain-containing protein [Mycolicibacterium]MCV7285720.1 DUF3311 domain-containing protein [Mycolicibacterium wolinskyi]MCV7291249.1 DUF3311 domain-containing protein [Mycolicibacterium goodii]ORX15637.1 hypothetical protein AWC31_24115 [Mycolicibacterium wolinskyi]
MTSTRSVENPPDDSPARQPLSWPKRLVCALLIGVPVVLALAVPFYQRTEPTLGGIPFFYWFQMAMAVAAACGCGASYFIAFRHEPEGGHEQ